MLRLTGQREVLLAIILMVVGYQNILVGQLYGVEEFPHFISWTMILVGVYAALWGFVKAPRDFGSSFVIVFIGMAGLYFGQELTMGTAGRMGPGYFPRLLSWLIMAMGAFIGLRALALEGGPVEKPVFRPMFFCLVSIIVFGYMMDYVGLAITAVVMTLISAYARKEVNLVETIIFAVGMSLFTVAVFVYGLGQPLPAWWGN